MNANSRKILSIVLMAIVFIAQSCSGIPDDVKAVQNFDLNRYMGTWYEIARLDSRFEKGLSHVTAKYKLNDDGSIEVTNRGWDTEKQTWDEIIGKAHVASDDGSASLKVSFFGPFYAGYNVIAIDTVAYSYALVCGSDREYLWLLSRIPILDRNITQEMLSQAATAGFDISKLVFVNHADPTDEVK